MKPGLHVRPEVLPLSEEDEQFYKGGAVQAFEYKFLDLAFIPGETPKHEAGRERAVALANELGAQGWELVCALPGGIPETARYCFKRPR